MCATQDFRPKNDLVSVSETMLLSLAVFSTLSTKPKQMLTINDDGGLNSGSI